MASLLMAGSQCRGAAKSVVKAADEAINTFDDLIKGSRNIADDFPGQRPPTADDVLRYEQSVPDPAAPLDRKVTSLTQQLQLSGDSEVTDETSRKVTCAVADAYLNLGRFPTTEDVTTYVADEVRDAAHPNVALASGAIEIIQGLQSESTVEQFLAAIKAGCLNQGF
ncbi:MAG TPA: hypothetical protein VG929_05980 [Actinomycetota bacterium]|nr:hypothetical protein [Actinomycetota bacterium]